MWRLCPAYERTCPGGLLQLWKSWNLPQIGFKTGSGFCENFFQCVKVISILAVNSVKKLIYSEVKIQKCLLLKKNV